MIAKSVAGDASSAPERTTFPDGLPHRPCAPLAAFRRGLNETEQMLVGAAGVVLAYLLLRSLARAIPGLAMGVLVLVIGLVGLRLAMRETFCSVQWPAVVAFMCD